MLIKPNRAPAELDHPKIKSQTFREKKNGHLPIFLALHFINVLSAMKAEPHTKSQRLC
jgi:hypothetical protein